MSKKPNPEMVDDQNPEWTVQNFAKARPASEVLPQLFGANLHRKCAHCASSLQSTRGGEWIGVDCHA